ncbi:hypothetical protein WDU94_013128 [Cyamophila willieti]
MSLLVLKLLTFFHLILGITAKTAYYTKCTKYTQDVLGSNSDAAPIVIKGLAIRSIPEFLNVTDNRYFGYHYDAEIWLIRIYKGHELLAKYFNETTADDVTRYSIIDR